MAMGGIGEAAMLGAVMGGGSAMLTGGDPLKGALMGGLTGGIGGAAGPALSSLTAPSVSLLEPAVTQAVTPALTDAVAPALTDAVTSNAVKQGILSNGLPTNISDAVIKQIAPSAVMPSAALPAVAPAVAPVASAASNVIPTPAFATAAGEIMPSNAGNLFGSASSTLPGIPTTAPPSTFMEGMAKFAKDPMASLMNNKFSAAGSALAGANAGKKKKEEEEEYAGPLSRFKYNPDAYRPSGYADGGIATLDSGNYDQMVGEQPMYTSNMAHGGIANLGSYSDGGRMLRGPGDGMSDSIPASIAGKRPARLADGEFVVPADVVSHLGNGSTDAGAKQLYAMMNKVRQARTGRKAQGREINPRQYVPA
jgi:hypothetical protein